MSQLVNRQFLLAARPLGNVKESDFHYREIPVSELQAGEFLIQTVLLAVGPSMRLWMVNRAASGERLEVGDLMRGGGVGRISASRHPDYAVGEVVLGGFGWQTYAVSNGKDRTPVERVDRRTLPLSTALGALGTAGLTAYFGLLSIGRAKRGERVVVSGAAGGVGSLVGQIAKIQGCEVIGIAGTDEKCRWLVDELGFDGSVNYRSDDLAARLRETCPGGIDVYYDNVGGEILDVALGQLAMGARVVICGATATYNLEGDAPGPANYFNLLYRRARMEGFSVVQFADRHSEARDQLARWVDEGRLVPTEDVLDGFENLPRALMRLYAGQNRGAQLVRV